MADQQNQIMPNLDSYNWVLVQAIGELVGDKPISDFSAAEQRELFSKMQSPPPKNPGVSVSQHMVKTPHGDVKTYLYKPEHSEGDLSFVFYTHGGGWVFGCASDFEPFLFDIVKRTGLAVVFPEYSLAPESKFPTQPEQCLEVLHYVLKHGGEHGLKVDKVVLAGDSAGGQLTVALSILNHQRSLHLPIAHQLLLHPVIDATAKMGTGIFWNPEWSEQQRGAYFSSMEDRSSILGSPGLMTVEQAKQYMPPTTIISSENDGFRPQDEAFSKLLQTAGVACGHLQAMASLHGVQLFNASRGSPTAQMIMSVIAAKLKEVLATEK